MTFIHIEIADVAATLEAEELVFKPVFDEWGLPSEPWTLVVDRNARLATKFEGVILASELRAALRDLLDASGLRHGEPDACPASPYSSRTGLSSV